MSSSPASPRIGVLTSGGDCPGLNAVLRGVVMACEPLGWEVLGFHEGFEGMASPRHYQVLTEATTRDIQRRGGTILGTTNRGRFAGKVGHGQIARVSDEAVELVRSAVAELNLTGLICIGGEGSLATAQQLFETGLPVVGVPKTIDNDIAATAMTFGFDSAVDCVVDALDRLSTTASSHRRVMVVEVMGRYTGWIALHGGVAGSANAILIPEIPFSYDRLAEHINRLFEAGNGSALVVVAEGARAEGGQYVTQEDGSAGIRGEHRLGGVAHQVARELALRTEHETRAVVLGHLQRGGVPTTLDRLLGVRFGVGAVQLIQEQAFGRMVTYLNYVVGSVPIIEAIRELKVVGADNQIVQTARTVGISFGD